MPQYKRDHVYQSRTSGSDNGSTQESSAKRFPSSRPSNYADRSSQPGDMHQAQSSWGSSSQGHYPRPTPIRQGYNAPSRQGDNLNQLWMGDLDPSWTESAIINIWVASGEAPVAAKIIRDRNAPTRGAYCFVTFKDRDAVAAALEKNGSPIPGSTKSFKLNWASGSNKAPGYAANSQARGGDAHQSRSLDFSIFVGDIAPDVTEDMLYAKFKEKFPKELSLVKIMTDPATKQPKGFGFVRFTTAEAQTKSLAAMNGVHVGSRAIRVGVAAGSLSHASNQAAPQSVTGVNTETANSVATVNLALPQPKLTAHTDPLNTSLDISNLPSHFSSDDLRDMFLGFGDIISYSMRETHGHVRYMWRNSAENALLFLMGTTLNGQKVKITWGSPSPQSEKYIGADAPDFNSYGATDFPCVWRDGRAVLYDNSEHYPVEIQNERLVQTTIHRDNILCDI